MNKNSCTLKYREGEAIPPVIDLLSTQFAGNAKSMSFFISALNGSLKSELHLLEKLLRYPDRDAWKEHEWEGGCEDLHIIDGDDETHSPSPAMTSSGPPGPLKIFTTGANEKTAEEFFELLTDAGVRRIIDVRLPGGTEHYQTPATEIIEP